MILQCANISKTFVFDKVLDNCSFHIEDREKAAIVGINGAGKSTLLKIIMGEMKSDEGLVTISRGKTMGYLAQHESVSSERTIFEELLDVKKDVLAMEQVLRELEISMKTSDGENLSILMEKYSVLSHEYERLNGYAVTSEITGILKGLGFIEAEFTKPVKNLSGGQKTRVALGRLLLSKPDLILLDEPTNHLDLESIAWLENYLLSYEGAVIIVAHDRFFLDKIVTKVIEIENSRCSMYLGNYTQYSQKKQMIRDAQLKQYLNQQQEIHHQEEVIAKLRSFNREKSIKRADSRAKMLAKVEMLEKPADLNDSMNFHIAPHIESGNDVLTVTSLSKSFPGKPLFQDISFEIKRGEHVALMGNNGTGKTTILKIINQLLPADSGTFHLGAKVCIGYYDQEHQVLHGNKTLFEELSDSYPDLTNTQIRNTLAAFLFTNDDVFKRIHELSGGERGRMSLAKLMLSKANFLILDEPTNHLDMVSKEILEHAINQYTGTVLYVSHDRYFINKTATRIMDLTSNCLVNYIGDYDYYLEKKDVLTSLALSGKKKEDSIVSPDTSANKADWQTQKEEQARRRKLESQIGKIEEKITSLERRDLEIDKLMNQEEIATNVSECMKLCQEKEDIANQLESLMGDWEQLQK